jgi:hypothetical protein
MAKPDFRDPFIGLTLIPRQQCIAIRPCIYHIHSLIILKLHLLDVKIGPQNEEINTKLTKSDKTNRDGISTVVSDHEKSHEKGESRKNNYRMHNDAGKSSNYCQFCDLAISTLIMLLINYK